MSEPEELELVVRRREVLADGVVRLTLGDPEGGPVPCWEPGAHLDLLLGPGVVRQYSLCGDPADRAELRVAVLLEPGGRGGSRAVHALAEGARIRARGPRNAFPLVPAARYLFIAGGIGITPLLPMLARAEAAGAPWRLVYGGRSRASMAFREELDARYPGRVEVRPQDETGLLDLDALLGSPEPGTAVYCCGPEPLIAATEERCAAWPPGTLRVERFTPRPDGPGDGGPGRGPDNGFEVELARSGTVVRVPGDRSILSALEEEGIDVLSSCREGTCGTCETPVLEGTPDHRDHLLTDEERAAGDTMMICVSRSRSPRLVLDL